MAVATTAAGDLPDWLDAEDVLGDDDDEGAFEEEEEERSL